MPIYIAIHMGFTPAFIEAQDIARNCRYYARVAAKDAAEAASAAAAADKQL